MEEEGVGLVLARATELRLKISNCIQKANPGKPYSLDKEQTDTGVTVNGEKIPNSHQSLNGEYDEEVEAEGETEGLLSIRDALESLEAQLVALQNLQHQQRYEKEVALAEIDCSRKALLEKLQKYQGKPLDVIPEACAFVGETVVNNNDLLLPPYPTRAPRTFVLDNAYLSDLQSTYKAFPNGVTNGDPKKILNGHEIRKQDASRNTRKGLGHFISSAFKTVLPLVGVIYVLSLSNFAPKLGKSTPLKFLGMIQQRATEEKNSTVQCPPGKVPVMEDGEARCMVKERIEVPFESVVAKPDVNYGCG